MRVPLVSVCLITYNHEEYIRKAIESVLMQETSFDWEFIIADDCSTDGTRAILEEYKAMHPDLIRLILQEKNIGPAQNWLQLITAPKSKYIAYFEGDDYWIDTQKLKKQVNFLEKNPTFSLCHSDVEVVDKQGNPILNHHLKVWNQKNNFLDYRFAIFTPLAFSCTAVFRNVLPVNRLSMRIKAGDWMQWVLLTLRGDAKFMNEKLSAYRSGSGISVSSVWHMDFHHRTFFLLRQLSLKNQFNKNKWLFKGALYFMLLQWSKVFKNRIFSKWATKIKYDI